MIDWRNICCLHARPSKSVSVEFSKTVYNKWVNGYKIMLLYSLHLLNVAAILFQNRSILFQDRIMQITKIVQHTNHLVCMLFWACYKKWQLKYCLRIPLVAQMAFECVRVSASSRKNRPETCTNSYSRLDFPMFNISSDFYLRVLADFRINCR